jgi:hypothetical protein
MEKDAPKITACKASEDWTSVTFKPDLSKFGMTALEADTVSLMRKRVYDLAGVLGRTCKVWAVGAFVCCQCELYPSPKVDWLPERGKGSALHCLSRPGLLCLSGSCPQQAGVQALAHRTAGANVLMFCVNQHVVLLLFRCT